MSIYLSQQTVMTDVDLLCQALDAAGVEYTHYPQKDGVYRRWAYRDYKNSRGEIRGRDAVLVMHGGLDTRLWACGDTAFVMEPDGRLRVELDIAHGNAPERWKSIQANYQALRLEAAASRAGYRCRRVEETPGRIKLHVLGVTPPQTFQSRRVRA